MTRHPAVTRRRRPYRHARLVHAVASLLVVSLLAAGIVVLVKAVNGDFSGSYNLVGMFSRAGEGIHPGSGVSYRGVRVGTVSSITLEDHQAKVILNMDSGFRAPMSAVATIRPKNLFGAESVSITFPPGSHGPWLRSGGRFRYTAVSDQITQFFAAADPLLARIDAPALASVISDLARVSSGEGPAIAASIRQGTKLASLLDATIGPQLSALDSFSAFNKAIAPIGPSVNSLSASSNQALPVFNAAAQKFQHFMDTMAPFAQQLATLLSDYHPDIVTLLVEGANVSRVLLARQANLGQVVSGLYQYVYRIAKGSGPETLPNGSKLAYYHTFLMFSQVNKLICSLIAPARPGLGYLAPLQQALSGAGTPLNCSSEIAAFDAAQGSGAANKVPASASTVGSTVTQPAGSLPVGTASQAAQKLLNSLYSEIGAPGVPARKSIASYLRMLTGSGLAP